MGKHYAYFDQLNKLGLEGICLYSILSLIWLTLRLQSHDLEVANSAEARDVVKQCIDLFHITVRTSLLGSNIS